MKKLLSILLVCSVLFSSCLTGLRYKRGGQTAGSEGGSPDAASGEVTPITFWLFNDVISATGKKWSVCIMRKNPDAPIDLIAEPYPVEEMHNKLQIAIQSGSGAPDIADVEIGKFPNFLRG